MEDDELVGEIVGRILAARGYQVLLSETGHEAVSAYSKGKVCGEPFDVVILDLHIPVGMNGKETLKKLLEIDPLVKAVVMSGDVTDPGITNFRAFGFKDALVKPFSPTELEKVLSALAPLTG